jgi:hypothetical protein
MKSLSFPPLLATLTVILALAVLSLLPAAAATIPGAGLPEPIQHQLFPVTGAIVVLQETALDNPDLPLLILLVADPPTPVLVVIDARNGTDTWSLETDPIIVIATQDETWVDTGFLTRGIAGGTFQPVESIEDALQLVTDHLTRRTAL